MLIAPIETPVAVSLGLPVTARATATAGQALPNSVVTHVNFDTVEYDTAGAITPGSGWVFTAPQTGYYHVSTSLLLAPSSIGVNAIFAVSLIKNGTTLTNLTRPTVVATATREFDLGGDTTIHLLAGDTLSVGLYNGNGADLNLLNDGTWNFISIDQVGTASAGGSPLPAAKAYGTTGQSIPDSASTIVNFDTVSYDTASAVTTGAGWVFTAPVTGKYHLSVGVLFAAAAWALGKATTLVSVINGTPFSTLDYRVIPAAQTFLLLVHGGDTFNLTAGDTLAVAVQQTSGSALPLQTDATDTYIAIEQVGAATGGGPRGELGYAQITANQTVTGTTPTLVTGLSLTVTLTARPIKITAYSDYVTNTIPGDFAVLDIYDVTAAASVGDGYASIQGHINACSRVQPGAGSRTYEVRIYGQGGSSTISASANQPAFLLIEEM